MPLSPVPAPTAERLADSPAVRFLVVGGLATVVDVALFNLLHVALGADPLLAKALSTAVAAVVAFAGNRWWSFDAAGQPLGGQVLPYLLVTVASLGVALVPVQVARLVGLDGPLAMNVAANVVGLGLATALRYVGYRRWVFAPDAAPVETRAHEPAPLRRAA